MESLVSVVIPTYNRSSILLETVHSVLNQTYKNIEVLIISDASTDDTANVINDLKDDRIIFKQLDENNKLPGRVRNYGLKLAKGEYIAFCDDDDIWIRKKIEFQLSVLTKDQNLDAVASNGTFFPGYKILIFNLFKNKKITYEDMFTTNYVITSSILIKKEALDAVGMFDEDARLIIAEDRDLWLRILRRKDESILLLKRSLIKYRLGNSKILTSFDSTKSYFSRMMYIYSKHLPFSQKFIDNLIIKRSLNEKHIFRSQMLGNISRDLYSRHLDIVGLLKMKDLNSVEKCKLLIKLIGKTILGKMQ